MLRKLLGLLGRSFSCGWSWTIWKTGYAKKPMTDLILKRFTFTDKSITGEISMEGIFQCFTLEPPLLSIGSSPKAIPEGRYEILMEWSTRFQMNTPHLQNVPERTFIEIHPGNKPEDTEGCILLGQDKNTDWVSGSRAAYAKLIPNIESALKEGKVFIQVGRSVA